MDTLERALRIDMHERKWNPRLELAVHGEPTMHPELVAMVGKLGSLKPRELILVTNGTGLCANPNKTIPQLVQAGITSICMDEYDGCDYVAKFKKRYTGPVPVHSFTGDEPTKFRSGKPKAPYIVIKNDVSHLTTPYDKTNTHCGGGGAPQSTNPAIAKRCAKPFRELTIRWDGNVSLCCNDFRGLYKVANIADHDTLDGVWQHERFDAARRMLYDGDRDFAPCSWCDALSPRVGLLPDKYGKQTMPKPTEHTTAVLAGAVAGPAYTLPVLRGWEQDPDTTCLPAGYPVSDLATQSID